MKKISADNWSIGSSEADTPESMGGGCYCDWTVDLIVAGEEHNLNGWNVCGWLAPGANQDLNGSGLALWGDSQPGGWTSCDDDGSQRGYPTADYEVEDNDDDTESIIITVSSSDNCDKVYEFEFDGTEAEAESLCDKISEALREANPGCDEPDSETIFDDIDYDAFNFGSDYPIRFGDWNDAGKVLAWKVGDEYDHRYWPDAGDVSDAMRAIKDDIETAILAVIEHDDSEEWAE